MKKNLLILCALAFGFPTFSQSITDGLKLHYSFKEIIEQTKIKDQAGTNNGTLINGATIGSADGHFYLDLPEVTTTARPYMEMGAEAGNIIAALNNFTIAFFMKVPTGFKSDFVWEFSNSFNMGTDANGHMFFDCVHQKTAITPTNFAGEGGNKLEIGTSIPTDVWFHYSFTFNNMEGIYYVNAVALDTATFATKPSDLGVTEYNWIGRCGYDGGGDLAGQYNVNPAKIADFRLYDRALTPDEVSLLSSGAGEKTSVLSKEGINSSVDIYPNPSLSFTNFSFRIDNPEFVSIEIFSMDGKKLETLINQMQPAGTYNIKWEASNYETGIYFYKLKIGKKAESGKIALVGKN